MSDENKDWEKLKKLIFKQAQCDYDEIKLNSSLVNDLNLDSIAIMSIILKAELIFKIEISGEDFRDYMINTPNDLLMVIKKNKTS